MSPKNLCETRKLAALTIKGAATKAGVSLGTMWAVERGRATLSDAQFSKLSDFYLTRIIARLGRFKKLLQEGKNGASGSAKQKAAGCGATDGGERKRIEQPDGNRA